MNPYPNVFKGFRVILLDMNDYSTVTHLVNLRGLTDTGSGCPANNVGQRLQANDRQQGRNAACRGRPSAYYLTCTVACVGIPALPYPRYSNSLSPSIRT